MRRLHPLGGRVLIAVLVLANIALLGVAIHLRHGKMAPAAVGAFHSPRPQSTRTTSPEPPVSSATKSPALLLSQASTKYALTATAGCHRSAHLAAYVNNGANAIPLTSPARHILALSATSSKRAWLVGANSGCHPTYYSTTDSGRTWTASKSSGDVWAPVAKGVQNPSGRVTRPCSAGAPEPIALASANVKRAIVICHRGVFRTTSAGRQWSTIDSLPAGRPVNLELRPNGHGTMLLKGLGSCSGLRIAQTGDLGGTWSVGDCLSNLQPPAAVAVDPHGDGLAAGVGQKYRTTDRGRNWV